MRIQRECNKRGYIFLGFNGDYKGGKTYLKLYNPETDNEWDTATVQGLLGGVGDPSIHVSGNKLSDIEYINKFHKAGFTKDYKFWRSDKLDKNGWKPYWYYTCPVCSNDEYVKAGVCSGVFESTGNNLSAGKMACRCNKQFGWTIEQREFKIKQLCEIDSFEFLCWNDFDKFCSKTTFNIKCKNNHDIVSDSDRFINSGYRCFRCAPRIPSMNGFYVTRSNDEDYLYLPLFKINDSFMIKCGRSFNPRERLLALKKYFNASKMNVISLYKGKHSDVYKIEQDIKRILHKKGLNYFEDWLGIQGGSECYKYCEESLIIIEDIIEKSHLERAE